ncbi:MAG TPA: P1 family peptidase, partial [Thermoplasmata archaeon]|nr:P1 family peptidase [Thermoplasmata archaeon]
MGRPVAKARPSAPVATPGVAVGHAADPAGPSGVTAILFDRPTRVVGEVRGPASGTYDVASLGVTATFGLRDALFFAGGSLFGLDAARGVRTRLLETGRGAPALGSRIPLPRISGAILFDLPREAEALPEYLALGYGAAKLAVAGLGPSGRVGAGAGARVAKYAGLELSRAGGVGADERRLPGGGRLGVLAVFNSGGALRDPLSGEWLRTAQDREGRAILPGSNRRVAAARAQRPATTLLLVVTDRPYDRRDLDRLALHAQEAVARTVYPAGTAF